MKYGRWAAVSVLTLTALAGGFTMTQELTSDRGTGSDRRYTNMDPMPASEASLPRMLRRYLFEKPKTARPADKTIPVQPLTANHLSDATGDTVYRLGHSTVLMRLDGALWLTDPVFSERASPVQWAGPRRFHPVPISLDELPPIDGVLISHNHYDHLDKGTIKRLHERVSQFLVPEGVAETLIDWGVDPNKIRELVWWEATSVGSITFTATPAQHFSGRGLSDANASLWVSWVIAASSQRLFFSGDSGYFSGFKAIGEAYGPFDLTMIETGAYDADWPGVHMQPEESLKAHRDLRGRTLMPIHNSTFDLAFHPWHEPLEHLARLAEQEQQTLVTPVIGEPWSLDRRDASQPWWRPLMARR